MVFCGLFPTGARVWGGWAALQGGRPQRHGRRRRAGTRGAC